MSLYEVEKKKKNNTYQCSAYCPVCLSLRADSFVSWPIHFLRAVWALSRRERKKTWGEYIKVVKKKFKRRLNEKEKKKKKQKEDSIISGSNHALVLYGGLLPAGLMHLYNIYFLKLRRLFYSLVRFITQHRRPYTLKAIIYCSIS